MLKKIAYLGLAIAVLAGAAPIFTSPVKAQTGIPQGYNVMPYVDNGRADDTIIQLNNLTVQGVSGSSRPGVIYASQSANISCVKYYSLSSASGYQMPCPELPPRILYQIQVDYDTVLLTRTRAKTNLSTFAPGDKINVYGFLDPSSNYVQALIVRDLDKPYYGGGGGYGYYQINGAEVLTEPSSSVSPATFLIGKQYTGCLDYSAGYGRSMVCPMGVSASAVQGDVSYQNYQNQIGGNYQTGAWPFTGTVYQVKTTPSTQVLSANRQPYYLSGIHTGHKVNVYGRFYDGVFEALIVRDLSSDGTSPIPVPVPNPTGQANLTVEVVDDTIRCIMAPCGLVNQVTVSIQKYGGVGFVGVTSGGRVTFRDIPSGTYSITLYQPGNQTKTGTVTIYAGENKTLTMYVSGWMGGGTISNINVTSPNGGSFTRGSNIPISWNIPSLPSGTMSAGSQFDIYAISQNVYGGVTGGFANAQYVLARNIFLDFGMTSYTYQWSAGSTQDGSSMPDGSYYIKICSAGTTTNCGQTVSPFALGSGYTGQVYLNNINPSSGYTGTTVALSGSGFPQSGNIIRMEMDGGNSVYLRNVYSNGSSITFQVPSYSTYSCFYSNPACMMASKLLSPGTYQVWVEGANGISNKVQFVLYSNSYFQQAQ